MGNEKENNWRKLFGRISSEFLQIQFPHGVKPRVCHGHESRLAFAQLFAIGASLNAHHNFATTWHIFKTLFTAIQQRFHDFFRDPKTSSSDSSLSLCNLSFNVVLLTPYAFTSRRLARSSAFYNDNCLVDGLSPYTLRDTWSSFRYLLSHIRAQRRPEQPPPAGDSSLYFSSLQVVEKSHADGYENLGTDSPVIGTPG